MGDVLPFGLLEITVFSCFGSAYFDTASDFGIAFFAKILYNG